MRNLTIKRTKSFVASIATVKVYIEDPEAGDLRINDVLCRKLGELRNGEEKTFQIENGEVKVFVIPDKLSRNLYSDYYPLPAGEEDIYLSGKNKYNPAAGNPFLFDGVTDENVLANRKKGNKKSGAILAIAIVVGLVVGFFFGRGIVRQDRNDPKDFSSNGMTVTLTEAFSEVSQEGFTTTFGSREVAVLVIKEEFTLLEGFENYTLEEYGELIIQNSGLEGISQLQMQEGITWFEYLFENPDVGETYWYFSTVYKSDDAFWMIQFATEEANAEEYASQFLQWAKTVHFD